MTLSKAQIEYNKVRYQKWFWIWERDLHWLANKYDGWAAKAFDLGYLSPWIYSPWKHEDAGKHIKYMINPYFGN